MIDTKWLIETEKSETLLINELSKNKESNQEEIYKFGFGQSPFYPTQSIINELKEHSYRKDYTPVQGILELRQAVATFHQKFNKINIDPSQIIIAPGSKLILYMTMAAIKQADILLPNPCWVSYKPQAIHCHHNIINVEASYQSKWLIEAKTLDQALSTRANPKKPAILILNYPCNPTGTTFNPSQLQEIASIAKKHNLIIVSDEIYGPLTFNNNHETIAQYYPEGTIITSGLSKWCGAGGWRLGIGIIPKQLGQDYFDRLLGIASETYSSASTPIQMAAIKAYQWSTELEDYLKKQQHILQTIGTYCAEKLQKNHVLTHQPEGGFYLFPDFSYYKEKLNKKNIHTNVQMCKSCLEESGVALLAGAAFGQAPEKLTARLSFVDFDGETLMNLKKPLSKEDLEKFAPKITKGMNKLIDWLNQL